MYRHTTFLLITFCFTPIAALGQGAPEPDGFFDDVRQVPNININSNFDLGPTVTSDGREIYFQSFRGGVPSTLYAAARRDPAEDFGDPVRLVNLDGTGAEAGPSISRDGLELFYRSGGADGGDLFLAKREEEEKGNPAAFTLERELDELNTPSQEDHPCINGDGTELYFVSDRDGGVNRIWVARRAPGEERFGEPQLVAAVLPDPDPIIPLDPTISGDGRTLFWRRTATHGGQGLFDLWFLRREATTDEVGNRIPFTGDPQNLGLPVNSPESEFFAHISFDWPAQGSKIYFTRGADIYEATWNVVAKPFFRRGDCNDDGTVNISDAVFSLGSLFLAAGDPACDDACDSNDDGTVDISDAINTLGVLFLGSGVVPPPGMTECGVDPTDDEVGCDAVERCP